METDEANSLDSKRFVSTGVLVRQNKSRVGGIQSFDLGKVKKEPFTAS